jgi:hypothetical protein
MGSMSRRPLSAALGVVPGNIRCGTPIRSFLLYFTSARLAHPFKMVAEITSVNAVHPVVFVSGM